MSVSFLAVKMELGLFLTYTYNYICIYVYTYLCVYMYTRMFMCMDVFTFPKILLMVIWMQLREKLQGSVGWYDQE